MAVININNGIGIGFSADEAAEAIEAFAQEHERWTYAEVWETIVSYMDDDTREEVHRELAPCTEVEFLTEYLRRAPCDLVIG